MPRSLSGGAIAGAVVGSVIGASFILLCLSPFILRAIRQRSARKRYPELDAPDMATGPDFGGLPAGSAMGVSSATHSSRRLSIRHHVVPDQPFRPQPDKGSAVNGAVGYAGTGQFAPSQASAATMPSPISPMVPSQQEFPSVAGQLATGPALETRRPSPAEDGRAGQNLPTPEASPIELGAESPQTATHHHHHRIADAMKHIADAIRKPTRSSTDRQFDSPSRSPTWDQNQYLTSTVSAPPIFDSSYGDDPQGAAYSYYHDPDLLSESPTSASPVQQGAAIYPPPSGAGAAMYNMSVMSAPAGMASVPRSDSQYAYAPQIGSSPTEASSPYIKSEPSPEDESTVSPGTPIARDSGLPAAGAARGRIQELKEEEEPAAPGAGTVKKMMRMDSLPITGITADSPTTRQGAVDLPAPSISPMVIMAPSNDAEMTHRVKHELDVIANSPPPQPPAPNIIEPSDTVTESSPEPPYHDENDGRDMDMLEVSDYSTPAAFSHSSASLQNTPDTRISDTFTASPSPRPPPDESCDFVAASVERPDSVTAQRYPCDECPKVFDQLHKLNHHKRYHDKPHICPHPDCGMGFGTRTHLVRHINDKHDKTRRYFCMVAGCPYSRQGGRSFPRKDNWRRHMQNKHQITPETEPGAEFVDEVMGGMT